MPGEPRLGFARIDRAHRLEARFHLRRFERLHRRFAIEQGGAPLCRCFGQARWRVHHLHFAIGHGQLGELRAEHANIEARAGRFEAPHAGIDDEGPCRIRRDLEGRLTAHEKDLASARRIFDGHLRAGIECDDCAVRQGHIAALADGGGVDPVAREQARFIERQLDDAARRAGADHHDRR